MRNFLFVMMVALAATDLATAQNFFDNAQAAFDHSARVALSDVSVAGITVAGSCISRDAVNDTTPAHIDLKAFPADPVLGPNISVVIWTDFQGDPSNPPIHLIKDGNGDYSWWHVGASGSIIGYFTLRKLVNGNGVTWLTRRADAFGPDLYCYFSDSE